MFFLTNCSELKVVENIRNFNVHKVAILVVKLVMNVNRFHSFVVVMVQLLLHRCVIPLYYYYCHTIISYKNIRFGVYRIQSSQFFLENLFVLFIMFASWLFQSSIFTDTSNLVLLTPKNCATNYLDSLLKLAIFHMHKTNCLMRFNKFKINTTFFFSFFATKLLCKLQMFWKASFSYTAEPSVFAVTQLLILLKKPNFPIIR